MLEPTVDLPTTPVGDQVVEADRAVRAGASKLWIVGASIVLAMVIALATTVVVVMSSSAP